MLHPTTYDLCPHPITHYHHGGCTNFKNRVRINRYRVLKAYSSKRFSKNMYGLFTESRVLQNENSVTMHKKRQALTFNTIWNWEINFILRQMLQLGESYWLRLSIRYWSCLKVVLDEVAKEELSAHSYRENAVSCRTHMETYKRFRSPAEKQIIIIIIILHEVKSTASRMLLFRNLLDHTTRLQHNKVRQAKTAPVHVLKAWRYTFTHSWPQAPDGSERPTSLPVASTRGQERPICTESTVWAPPPVLTFRRIGNQTPYCPPSPKPISYTYANAAPK